ncbi:MAG: hypothetical protein JWM62_1237, partial [Frankiales bacterium]|nr:hypothetical protein [Frankiales bacterium]
MAVLTRQPALLWPGILRMISDGRGGFSGGRAPGAW